MFGLYFVVVENAALMYDVSAVDWEEFVISYRKHTKVLVSVQCDDCNPTIYMCCFSCTEMGAEKI